MNTRFYCVSCGKEVPADQKTCPGCGRVFDAVRCPKCGFEGGAGRFRAGCPSCGYLRDRKPGRPDRRVRPGRPPLLSARAYRLTALALLALLAVLTALLLR